MQMAKYQSLKFRKQSNNPGVIPNGPGVISQEDIAWCDLWLEYLNQECDLQ